MTAGEHRLALPAGFRLGKYNLLSVLGAGGFGITYLAEDYSLGRRVAIKELLPNEIATRLDGSTVVAKTKSEEENLAWARDRFVQEGRALAACDHPNVVNVYEMIEANGTAYMVTKFEEGRSFSEWLKEVGGAPTEKELRAILLPLLSGLEKVHKAGFLHRDLKPENIYLTDDGRPILLDFGSARQAVSDRTTSLTSIVTSGYAPFEQYHEDGKQGAWSDLYALAAVMFRAIHGKKPPEATRRLKDDPCPKLGKQHAGQYSARFLSAIDTALAVEPQKRPQSVAQWLEMLGESPTRKEVVVPPWWHLWLEKLQQGAELAKAKPSWAAGAGAMLLVLVLTLSRCGKREKILPPVPGPTISPSASVSASPVASASAHRETIVVPPPYNASPQSFDLGAMLAKAAPGATIIIPPGIYAGGLEATRAVRIVGDPKNVGEIFIKADGKECLSVRASGVFVQNVQFLCGGIGKLAAISVNNGGELEMEGCTVQSGTDIGLLATGNASVKLNATSFTTPSGTAVRLTEHAKATLTQCHFPDMPTGLNVLSGSTAELHSCAFERNGGYNGFGAILALNGQGTSLTADDCRFTANKAGIVVSENASLAITNSSVKENSAGAEGGIVGLISVRRSARATLSNDTFERNQQGVAVTEGSNLEMQKCTFDQNGIAQRGGVAGGVVPLLIAGQGSAAIVRQSVFSRSAPYGVSVIASARLTLENSEISGTSETGLVVGDRSAPGGAVEIKGTHFLGNGIGLGLCAGASAVVEDSEFRENKDGIVVIDPNSSLSLTKSTVLANRGVGLHVFSGASATVTDSELRENEIGAMSGTRGKSNQRGSITLVHCSIGGNRSYGASVARDSQLILDNSVFNGPDRTAIFKERGAIVTEKVPPSLSSPEPEVSPSPESSPSSSPGEAKSTPLPRRKTTPRPHPRTPDNIGRALRRLLPGGR
jgi:serine/threonine protein kinase